jgi:hypothetical protein
MSGTSSVEIECNIATDKNQGTKKCFAKQLAVDVDSTVVDHTRTLGVPLCFHHFPAPTPAQPPSHVA